VEEEKRRYAGIDDAMVLSIAQITGHNRPPPGTAPPPQTPPRPRRTPRSGSKVCDPWPTPQPPAGS
jgi:hypothetical protein